MNLCDWAVVSIGLVTGIFIFIIIVMIFFWNVILLYFAKIIIESGVLKPIADTIRFLKNPGDSISGALQI